MRRFSHILTLCLSFGSTACVPSSNTTYKDQDIVVVGKDLVNLLNVHASSSDREIRAAGKVFKHVFGGNQPFLRASDTNVIIFVTGGNYVGHDAQPLDLHVLNLKTKNDAVVRIGQSVDYELWIDASKAPNDVKMESYDSRKLVLVASRTKIGSGGKYVPIGRLEFDLENRRMIDRGEER